MMNVSQQTMAPGSQVTTYPKLGEVAHYKPDIDAPAEVLSCGKGAMSAVGMAHSSL